MLSFKVAQTTVDLIEAWSTVYKQFIHINILEPNPHKLWTFPEYFQGSSLTLSAYFDNTFLATASINWGDQLPLDHFYPEELAALRAEKGMLVEIGLKAKVNNKVPREYILKLEAVMCSLMRDSLKQTYAVCGLHPQICKVYGERFGFVQAGEDKEYSFLKNAPVRLMHGDVRNYAPINDLDPSQLPKFDDRIILTKEKVINEPRLLAFAEAIIHH